MTVSLKEVIILASGEQMRAILSILVVAIVGLVPRNQHGYWFRCSASVGTVIIGGLTSTLIFAPM